MQVSSYSAREIYTMDAKRILVYFKDYCSEGQSELDGLIEVARKAFKSSMKIPLSLKDMILST